MLHLRGDARVRRLLGRRTSPEPAERARFAREMRRLRAWLDLQLGSLVHSDDKDALLRETLSDVVAGRAGLSTRVFESDDEFEIELRCLLGERCQVWLGGP